jgi:hypothetical protein
MEDVIGTSIPREERDGDGDVMMAPEAGRSCKIQIQVAAITIRDELMNTVFLQIVILSPSFPPRSLIIRILDLPSTSGCLLISKKPTTCRLLLRKVTQKATMIS